MSSEESAANPRCLRSSVVQLRSYHKGHHPRPGNKAFGAYCKKEYLMLATSGAVLLYAPREAEEDWALFNPSTYDLSAGVLPALKRIFGAEGETGEAPPRPPQNSGPSSLGPSLALTSPLADSERLQASAGPSQESTHVLSLSIALTHVAGAECADDGRELLLRFEPTVTDRGLTPRGLATAALVFRGLMLPLALPLEAASSNSWSVDAYLAGSNPRDEEEGGVVAHTLRLAFSSPGEALAMARAIRGARLRLRGALKVLDAAGGAGDGENASDVDRAKRARAGAASGAAADPAAPRPLLVYAQSPSASAVLCSSPSWGQRFFLGTPVPQTLVVLLASTLGTAEVAIPSAQVAAAAAALRSPAERGVLVAEAEVRGGRARDGRRLVARLFVEVGVTFEGGGDLVDVGGGGSEVAASAGAGDSGAAPAPAPPRHAPLLVAALALLFLALPSSLLKALGLLTLGALLRDGAVLASFPALSRLLRALQAPEPSRIRPPALKLDQSDSAAFPGSPFQHSAPSTAVFAAPQQTCAFSLRSADIVEEEPCHPAPPLQHTVSSSLPSGSEALSLAAESSYRRSGLALAAPGFKKAAALDAVAETEGEGGKGEPDADDSASPEAPEPPSLPPSLARLVHANPRALPADVAARFLRALGDQGAALAAAERLVAWHREQGARDPLATPQPHFATIKQLYPHGLLGWSRDGKHLVELECMSSLPAAYPRLLAKGVAQDDLLRHLVFTYTYAFARVDTRPCPQGCTVKIVDLGMLNFGDLKSDGFRFVSKAGSVLTVNFPLRLHVAFLINAPGWWAVAWKIVAPLVNKNVRERMVVFGRKEQAAMKRALLEYVREEDLPVQYGGKCTTPLDQLPMEKKLAAFVQTLNGT